MDALIEFLLYFAEAIVGDNKRFFACFVPGVVVMVLIIWLVPGWGWRVALSVPTIAAGILVGIVWERNDR
jgi:hypothetical protein